MEFNTGDRVSSGSSPILGTIVLAYRGQVQIVWDNGASGSFNQQQIETNNIRKV